MDTVAGNGHGDPSSILERGCLYSTLRKYSWER